MNISKLWNIYIGAVLAGSLVVAVALAALLGALLGRWM